MNNSNIAYVHREVRPDTPHSWMLDIACLSAIFIVFYLLWIGSYPLFTPDEGRYSEVAREMVATHDYVTPRVNGIPFLDKPVLYYWLQASAIHLFGIKEWALRFFPALFGVLGCIVTYICGRCLFNRRVGLIAAIILATTPLYFGCAHYADLNLEVAVLISCSLLFFITGVQSSPKARDKFLLAAYIFSAFAFLTKGLIGIAFPAMIIGTWILLTGRFHTIKHMRLVSGSFLFLIITLPWYLLVQRANPAFLHYFFVTQQVTRFLSAGEFNNKTPFWFYAPIILIGFLPWTLFLVQALRHSIKAIWQARHQHTTELFLFIWFTIIFIFFSIPHSKTIGYILPVFPPLALFVGFYISQYWYALKKYVIASAIISSLFLLIVVWNAPYLNKHSAKPLVTQLQTIIKPQDEVVNYFRFFYDVPLYLGKRVTVVADWNAPDINQKDNWIREFSVGMPFQDTHAWLIDEKTFWARFNSNKRMFVFTSVNFLNRFKSQVTHFYVLGQSNNIILVSNQA